MKTPLLAPPRRYSGLSHFFICTLPVIVLFGFVFLVRPRIIKSSVKYFETNVAARAPRGQQYVDCRSYRIGDPQDICHACKQDTVQFPCVASSSYGREYDVLIFGLCGIDDVCHPAHDAFIDIEPLEETRDVLQPFPRFNDAPYAYSLRCNGGRMEPQDSWKMLLDMQRHCLHNPVWNQRISSARAEVEKFVGACGSFLQSSNTEQNMALWSGDMALSMFANSEGFTTLESTPLGNILNKKLEFLLWKDHCISELWSALDKAYVNELGSETVEVYMNSFRHSSILLSKSIPQLLANSGFGADVRNVFRMPGGANARVKYLRFHIMNDACRMPFDDSGRNAQWFRIAGEKDCFELGTFQCFKDENLIRCIAQALCGNPVYRSTGFYVDLRPIDWQSRLIGWHPEVNSALDIQNQFSSMEYIHTRVGEKNGMKKRVTHDRVWEKFCSDSRLGGGERIERPGTSIFRRPAEIESDGSSDTSMASPRYRAIGSFASASASTLNNAPITERGQVNRMNPLQKIADCFNMAGCFGKERSSLS